VLHGTEHFLNRRLNSLSRLCILAAAGCIILSFLFPLYHIHLVAPQYRDGLDLWIYGYKIESGNEGQDLKEINILNHYIGMQHVTEADFMEMKIIPFALGIFILLGLRAVVFGRMHDLVDYIVIFAYFCLFSLGVFLYRMYSYGHFLDPKAPINPPPFWPSLFGTKQIANMTQTSLPGLASYLLVGAFVFMLLAMFCSRKEQPFFVPPRQEA
jgi:hypothetical protein